MTKHKDEARADRAEELAREIDQIYMQQGDIGPSDNRVDWLAALLRSRMGAERWIPVSERLPECGDWFFDDQAPLEGYRTSKSLLVQTAAEVTIAHYAECTNDGGQTLSDDGWTSDHRNDSDKLLDVIKWRPLPSAPDTEEKA